MTSAVIIWAIFGVATVTLLIAVLTEVYANRYKSALVRKGTKRAIHAIKEHRDHMMQERFGNQEQEHGPERIERLPYEVGLAFISKRKLMESDPRHDQDFPPARGGFAAWRN
jgi:hypothetical protein